MLRSKGHVFRACTKRHDAAKVMLEKEVREVYHSFMNVLESIVLGVVQGITEFLPVSSYGQLLLLKYMLGVSNAGNHFFEIFLHMGTAIAISIVFRKDIKRIYQAMLQMLPTVFYNIKT